MYENITDIECKFDLDLIFSVDTWFDHNQVTSQMGNLFLPKFCYIHFVMVRFVILLILFYYMETILVGVISVFEVNMINI